MNQKNINQKASDEFLIVRLIPNVFTTVGMCIGLTGIRFAIECDWKSAVICVLIAAFFDLVDGLTARLLKATSRIGAELDSLSDAVSFGVTPTIILYLWVVSMTTDDNTYLLGWYWIPFIFYSSCCVLRLARFNIANRDLHKENLKSARNYFHGVPSPAAAISLLFPIILEINLVRFGYGESKNLPFIICIWVMTVSYTHLTLPTNREV